MVDWSTDAGIDASTGTGDLVMGDVDLLRSALGEYGYLDLELLPLFSVVFSP